VQEQFTPPPPRDPNAERGLRAWRASSAWIFSGLLLTMIGVMFAIRFASSAVQPILPLYMEQMPGGAHFLGLNSATVTGLAMGILGLTSALSSVALGRMGDRSGHQRILLACMFASGALYLPMALASAAWQLILLQAIFGIAAGGLSPSANAIIARNTPAEKRGVIYGVTAGAASLGAFFGPLLGAGVAAGFGYPAAFGATGVMLLIFSALAWRVLRRQPEIDPAA
jgi:MFS transporter, DHA1 family, multidrug resistance protein